jgi:hypothetical protein
MSPILGIWASSKAVAAADTGAMFPLQVITVGATAVSNVTFTNIPSTYSHLQVRLISRNSTTDNTTIYMQFNNDTATNYNFHLLYGTGSAAGAAAGTSSAQIEIGEQPNGANIFNASVIDILDYKDTNKYKTIRALGGFDSNGDGRIILRSGAWRSTSAISSIKFTLQTGNFTQYSQFAIYGVKSA